MVVERKVAFAAMAGASLLVGTMMETWATLVTWGANCSLEDCTATYRISFSTPLVSVGFGFAWRLLRRDAQLGEAVLLGALGVLPTACVLAYGGISDDPPVSPGDVYLGLLLASAWVTVGIAASLVGWVLSMLVRR